MDHFVNVLSPNCSYVILSKLEPSGYGKRTLCNAYSKSPITLRNMKAIWLRMILITLFQLYGKFWKWIGFCYFRWTAFSICIQSRTYKIWSNRRNLRSLSCRCVLIILAMASVDFSLSKVRSLYLTLKHRETHGCLVSTVASDALVLKHQAISIHNAD